MEDFDWKKTLKTNILSLKILGLWPKGNETYKPNSYTAYAAFCVLGLLCSHSFVQTFNIYFIMNDLEAFTSSIFVTLSCIGTVAKTYYLLQNMKTLKQLFVNITDDIFQPRNDRQIRLIQPSILFWRRFYLVFRVLCYNTTFLLVDLPYLGQMDQSTSLTLSSVVPLRQQDFAIVRNHLHPPSCLDLVPGFG
jgi:hypothetical protein